MDKFIHLKDQYKSNDLDAYELDGAVCIQVFEFECELSKDDTVKLRDFLDSVVKSNRGIDGKSPSM